MQALHIECTKAKVSYFGTRVGSVQRFLCAHFSCKSLHLKHLNQAKRYELVQLSQYVVPVYYTSRRFVQFKREACDGFREEFSVL